ncbi:MAG: glycosyltransferase family 4 protein [Planctomycetota bacterium]
MRVLHVMEATIGGTRRHLGDVVRGELAAGLEVHAAVSSLRQPDFEHDISALEACGARILRLPMVRALSPARDLAHLRALARHLERIQPDVVHTHSSKGGALGRAASIATGIGVRVHTPHTFAFLFDAMFGALKRRLFREIEAHLGAHTQAVIAVSASEAATIARSGVVDAARVRVVENGIDPAPFSDAVPVARTELGVPSGVPLAAVVGLLNVAKGQDLALRALALPGLERLHLLVAGHGEMRGELEALATELGVAARVRFLGYRTDVASLLAASDFVLVPSRWEGMPYIVLEAMASARPVVATPVDGARDLVADGETGFLAAEISAGAIAEACGKLLASSAATRTRLGTSARERMIARHSAERMVAELASVYRSVA